MKPLFLSIQAFGPFSDVQQLDFTRLGENALFLINGPTGAGKSSLLDAICFALYGVTTGGEREASSMRNDLAPDNLQTEVRFEFQLGDQVICIRRQPTQEAAKKRGEGTTTRQTEAWVYRLSRQDWTPGLDDREAALVPLKGVREVNDWVQQLTGLSADQFRQVMVLPQGKFRDLLLASSNDREQIFSQLFQTKIFKDLEEKLQAEAAGLKRERETLVDKRQALLDLVEVNSVDELEAQLVELNAQLSLAQKQLDERLKQTQQAQKALDTATALEQKFTEMQALKKKEEEHKSRSVETQKNQQRLQQASEAYRLQPIYKQLQNTRNKVTEQTEAVVKAQKTVEQLVAGRKTAQSALSEAEAAWKGLDHLKTERQHLTGLQTQLAELDRVRTENQNARKAQQQADKALQGHLHQHQQLQKNLLLLEQDVEKLRADSASKAECELRLARLDEFGRLRAQWQTLQDQQVKLQTALSSNEQGVSQNQIEVDSKRQALMRTELAWHQGQAAILAQALEDGQPCPVCGSLEHPQPAENKAEQSVTQESLEQERSAFEKLQGQLHKAQSEGQGLQKELELNVRQANELNEKLGDYAHTSLEQMRNDYSSVRAQLKAIEQAEKTLDKKASERTDRQTALAQSSEQETSLRSASEVAIRQLAASDQSLKNLRQSIPEQWREPGALVKRVNELQQSIERIDKTYHQAHQRWQSLTSELSAAEAHKASAESNLHSSRTETEQAQLAWEAEKAQSRFATDAEFQSAILSKAEMDALQQSWDQYQEQGHRLAAQLEDLTRLLAGQTPPDLASLKTALTETQARQAEAERAHHQLKSDVDKRQAVRKRLAETQASMEKLDQRYAVTGTLADVATGRNAQKVSLQRFVLSVLLDDVLIEATRRLSVMSKGRYQLLRKQDRSKGNRASGLELEVEDAYTGKSRPVNTLSGGESFLAALALALGLSDVVQAYAGGIRLDTLFIDEGFGSLDPDSLDLAIQTLMELRANGRTIGIISHVSELKEQMPLRIDVKPSRAGSEVVVVC